MIQGRVLANVEGRVVATYSFFPHQEPPMDRPIPAAIRRKRDSAERRRTQQHRQRRSGTPPRVAIARGSVPLTHDSASVVRVGLPGRCRGWPRWLIGAASHDPLILDRQRRSPRYRWSWPSPTDGWQRACVDEVPGGQRQAGQATEGAMMAEGLGMQPQSAVRRGPGSLMRAWLQGWLGRWVRRGRWA